MLEGRNVVVYDLEIKKTIDQCSKGWASHDEMGISVGCAYDYRSEKFRVFMDDNMQELVDRLNEPQTIVVAFNHINFDNKLLRASGFNLKPDSELKNYDMLQVSRDGAGLSVNARVPGFKLDQHLETLGLPMKTGDGAMAPIWWQEGKIGKVIDYCMNDVTQEKNLFEFMVKFGKCGSAHKSFYSVLSPYQWFTSKKELKKTA